MLEQFKSLRIRRINGGFTYLATQMDNGNWSFVRDDGTLTDILSAEGFKKELRSGRLEVVDNYLADAINAHYTGSKQVISIKVDTAGVMDELTAGIVAEANARAQDDAALSGAIVAEAQARQQNVQELGKRIDELHERIEPSSVETVQCAQHIISPTIWQLRRARVITVRGKTEFRAHPSHAFFNPMLHGDLQGEQVTIEYFSDAVWQPYAEEQFKAARRALHLAADAAADARDAWNRADRAYLEAHRVQEGWYDNLR